MRYLYGDSTPFPLATNFIDTLRALIESCAGLLAMEEEIDQFVHQATVHQAMADTDVSRLDMLGAAIVGVLEAHQDDSESVRTAELSLQLRQMTGRALERAKSEATNRRDRALGDAESKTLECRRRTPEVLERFLLQHELPDTVWGMRWEAEAESGPSNARAVASTPFELEASFDLEIDANDRWARPVKVSDLRPVEITLQLPQQVKGKSKLKKVRVDRYFVTRVGLTPKRGELVLRRAPKANAPGVEVLYTEQSGGPVARLVDDGDDCEHVALAGAEATEINGIWTEVEAQLRPLIHRRARLTDAMLRGVGLRHLEQPGEVSRVLIDAVAPLVRELSRRSPVAGELVLKREVENGRREELFISAAELQSKLAGLSPQRLSQFDPLELRLGGSSETSSAAMPTATGEVDTRDLADQRRSRPTAQIEFAGDDEPTTSS